jgi:hypothetical protein
MKENDELAMDSMIIGNQFWGDARHTWIGRGRKCIVIDDIKNSIFSAEDESNMFTYNILGVPNKFHFGEIINPILVSEDELMTAIAKIQNFYNQKGHYVAVKIQDGLHNMQNRPSVNKARYVVSEQFEVGKYKIFEKDAMQIHNYLKEQSIPLGLINMRISSGKDKEIIIYGIDNKFSIFETFKYEDFGKWQATSGTEQGKEDEAKLVFNYETFNEEERRIAPKGLYKVFLNYGYSGYKVKGWVDINNEAKNLQLLQECKMIRGEEYWFTGLYWKYNKAIEDIDGEKLILGKESEDKLMQCDKEGKGIFGLSNTLDLWLKEKLNKDVNQLLDDFVEIFPEMKGEVILTKEKFPTISTYSKFDLKWKLTSYLMYMKEQDRKAILGENSKRSYNIQGVLERSNEILNWLEEAQRDKYDEFFNAITFINFGQSINISYYTGLDWFIINNEKLL